MTNQKHYPDLGSDTSSVWNFNARYSDVLWRESQRWRRKMSAIFSGYFMCKVRTKCDEPKANERKQGTMPIALSSSHIKLFSELGWPGLSVPRVKVKLAWHYHNESCPVLSNFSNRVLFIFRDVKNWKVWIFSFSSNMVPVELSKIKPQDLFKFAIKGRCLF